MGQTDDQKISPLNRDRVLRFEADPRNVWIASHDLGLVQDFDTRWDQIQKGTREIPEENVLEGLCIKK